MRITIEKKSSGLLIRVEHEGRKEEHCTNKYRGLMLLLRDYLFNGRKVEGEETALSTVREK